MLDKLRIREWIDSALEKISEQVWFQQVKAKWDELDHQSQIYLKFAGVGAGVFLTVCLILSSIWSVHRLKMELTDKRALLVQLQAANDELRRLRDSLPSSVLSGDFSTNPVTSGPWVPYFENLGSTAGLDKTMTISSEKAGASSEQIKEVFFELSLKKVNIKQLTRYAFALENGPRPVKLKQLIIHTQHDLSGYLDATLAVSAFNLVVQK